MSDGSQDPVLLLQSRIEANVTKFRRARDRHWWRYALLRYPAIAFSSLVTVLLGWRLADGSAHREALVNLALVLSAAVSALSTAESLGDHRNIWNVVQKGLNELRYLQLDFDFWNTAGRKDLDTALPTFKDRLSEILRSIDAQWVAAREQAGEADRPAPR